MSAISTNTRLRVSDRLRRVWPRDTAKLAAIAAGQSVRTAQAWVSERCTPSMDTVLRMAARNDELRLALIQALQEPMNEPRPSERVPDAGTCADEYEGYPLGQLGT